MPLILLLILLFSISLSSSALANDGTNALAKDCQQQLQQSEQKLSQLTPCQSLIKQTSGDNASDTLFVIGHLLVNSKHKHNHSFRQKRGLFYWVLAADKNNIGAIKGLSEFVKNKMVDGKIPIKYSHYLSYLEADWQLNQQDPKHHYGRYQAWLEQVELSHLNPQKLGVKQLIDIATAFENGYYLGQNLEHAQQLYQLAAARKDPIGLYKTAEFIYQQNQPQALAYLHQAAKLQSSDAMLKLGDHFACNGDKLKGEQLYKQAIAAGNEYAEDELESLRDSGKPSQC